MYKRTTITAVLVIGLFAVMAVAQGGPPQDSSGAIVGTVFDSATGGPLEGAQVVLSMFLIGGQAIDTAVTGADGKYSFSDLLTGRSNYGLTVSLQDYITATQSNIRLGVDQTDTVDFYLVAGADTTPATGSFSGTVTDSATGNPLSGALVVLSSGFGPVGQVVDSMYTGSDGAYLFDGLALDMRTNFTLSATAPNYSPQSVSNLFLTSANPDDTVDFELVSMDTANSWVVLGVVTADSATGASLEGALVEIKQTFGSELRYSAVTDQNGEYVVLIPITGVNYQITVSLDGYLTTQLDQRITGDSTQIDLILETDTSTAINGFGSLVTGNKMPISIYPNPAHGTQSISYELTKSNKVHLAIYMPSGRLVSTLVNGYKVSGKYSVLWEAKSISNGIYILKARIGDRRYSKTLLIHK